MSAPSPDNVISHNRLTRALIYTALILFAVYYLLPLYVMLVNSLKPLEEIRQGGMLNLPQVWTIEPWLQAWSTAQIGVQPTGLRPFFINSILMVVPAVVISTIIGARNSNTRELPAPLEIISKIVRGSRPAFMPSTMASADATLLMVTSRLATYFMRLPLPNGGDALLACGVRDPGAYEPGQGTDVLGFLAAVAAIALTRMP